MMWRALQLVALAAASLPASGISLWKNDTDYIHFTELQFSVMFQIMKSCFGEDVAVRLETFGFEVGQYCEETQQAGDTVFGGGSSSLRSKRSLMKMPENAPIGQIICNIEQMKLLTKEGQMDYDMVEELLRGTPMDNSLKFEMMEVLTYCRSQQKPLPDVLPGNPYNEVIKSVLYIENYFNCVVPEGIRTCKLHEMTRHFEELF